MIKAGIDIGAETTKAVIMSDGKVLARSITPTGLEQLGAVEKALADALTKSQLKREDLKAIVTTGVGRKSIPFATSDVTEIAAAAKGAIYLHPAARTVIDVGAEESRAIKVDANGKVADFAKNEKCAAGVGAFVASMARALEVKVEDMGKLSLQSNKDIPMNVTCVVFAESEVVSLIHAKTPKPDIARAIHDAIATRTTSMARRIGMEKDVILIGGVAKNPGVLDSLKRHLQTDVIIPEDPEFVGALGAAILAG